MLHHKSKTAPHAHLTPEPSPRATPIPIYHHPKTSHQHNIHSDSNDSRLVRRAFTSIQLAFQSTSSKKSGASEYNYENDPSIDSTHDNYNPNNAVHLPFSSNSYPSSNGHCINNNAHYPHNNLPSKSSYASYSPSLTPLNTDDDNSSSASFYRPRKLSKASMGPSPLGSSYTSTTFHAVSPSSPPTTALSSPMSKIPSQLRVRHLERDATYAGYLTKFSSRTFFSRKQWKRRYFILHQRSLHCFKSSDPQHPLLESIALCADTIICVTDIFSGKRYCLQITCPGEKNWYVLADSAAEMSGWLKELKGTVLQFRTNIDSRPATLYSESSEISDRSASTTTTNRAVAIPVPAIPSQYDYSDHARSYSGSSPYSTATLMSSTSKAHNGVNAHLHELYQGSNMMASLNPPPRATSPKLTAAAPGFSSKITPGTSTHSGYHQQQPPLPIQKQPEPTRRRNSSLSHVPPDYSSFGSVMERAEALSTAQKSTPTSSWTIPTKSEKIDTYATVPRNKRDSTVSSLASHRVSVLVDRPEAMITLPHRSSQRLMGSPSRPMSPVLSRPMSPNGNRTSPRSSLVISPPPRSIHRPASVSIRNSTQIIPPSSQLSALSLSSSSPLTTSPPKASLPPTPEPSTDQETPGSLSRITSLRVQPRNPGMSRQSVIGVMNNASPVGSGSLQERVQRNSSRSSILKMASPTGSAINSTANSSRPLSPTPSLADAPTLPLPEPPRSESNSPSKASRHSVSLITDSGVGLTRKSSSMVPRHQVPDLSVPVRSRARERSLSQESDKSSRSLAELQMAFKAKATTPSPRLSAILTSTTSTDKGQDDTRKSGSAYKQMSLPIHTNYILPAPPTGQQPPQPKSDTSQSANKQLLSASKTLRPISSNNGGVASLGGAVARRPSLANRDPVVAARLSALIAEPPTAAVPLPPVSASGPISVGVGSGLPAPPTKAPPKKPNGIIFDIQGTNKKGFEIIVEEEEDEEEDEDDVEFTPLDIEGLSIGANEYQNNETATTTDADIAASSLTLTRPEYYATKERKVVEYIFPSEAFSC
ncbi:hypothetical protein BGZ92_009135 [Podila epicladia]|nr:hypothetical protein BGZ92_009135 [Podila epicladia]